MQLNALSNYLQNQPLNTAASAESQAAATAESKPKPEIGAYSPSQRAILISAVASKFDIENLQQDDVSQLQQKLQQYGLIQGEDLAGFALLHNARSQLNDGESLNALGLLEQVQQRLEVDQVGYSQRVQINRMHTLAENLSSARHLIQRQSA